MPPLARCIASAARLPAWVGPGAPHPEALDALERNVRAISLSVDDFVIAHAGSFAIVLALARGDHPTRDEFRTAIHEAWAGAGREATRRGLAPAKGASVDVELAFPATPDRLALFLAFNAGEGVAGEVARRAGREAVAAGAGADSFLLARLGDDPGAIAAWLDAWSASGVPWASVERAAHPSDRARVVALGFEIAGGVLLGPIDLVEADWVPSR